MATTKQGDIINQTSLIYVGTYPSFSGADSLCYWSNVTYFYIAAYCFAMEFKGNYALVCPGYKVWLEKWNGSAWEEIAYKYVKNNRKGFYVNDDAEIYNTEDKFIYEGDGFIYRFKMQPWEGSYREYLGADLSINGIGNADNYKKSVKGRKIGYVSPNSVQYVKLSQEDLTPSQVSIYNTTISRGAPILASSRFHKFVPVD